MKQAYSRFGAIWRTAVVLMAGLAAGFLLASHVYRRPRYHCLVDELWRLNFLPVGKLAPGTYYIPVRHGGTPVVCRVITDSRTGNLREIDIVHGAKSDNFSFVYKLDDKFGVPLASLLTGSPSHVWIDVGLKGRFLIEGGSHGGPHMLLNGRWVRGGHLLGDTLEYGGKKYRYDKTTGGWDPLPTSTAPAGKKIAKGKAGMEQR